MRIDNRKVNGQITIEPEDTIRTWMIAVNGQTAFWFTIMLIETSGNVKVLPMPAYTFNQGITKLTVDIGEIMAGHTLEIALPSGVITIKESK